MPKSLKNHNQCPLLDNGSCDRRMHAVVKRNREPGAEIEEVAKPVAGKGEVLVQTKMTSICGTDVHIWDWNHWAQKRVKALPIVFGHEFCGEVVEVGKGV